MSVTMSRAEGVITYSIHSNPKSKWPLFCQILGTLCYSPVCSVSLRLKKLFGCVHTALATIQIMVGMMNLGFGSLTTALYAISFLGPIPLCLGSTIIAVGILCILTRKYPSPCLVVLSVLMNIVSAGIAIATIVLYSVDLAQTSFYYWCHLPERERDRYSWTTASPEKKDKLEEIYQRRLEDYEACQQNRRIMKTILGGMDIMMIVLAVLQLCVAISWCVLNIKALCKKEADKQEVEDPEVSKPLIEDETPDPVC